MHMANHGGAYGTTVENRAPVFNQAHTIHLYNQTVNAANTDSRHGKPHEISDDDLKDAILRSLSFPEMFQRRNNVRGPHRNTCEWILKNEQYVTWLARERGTLWIRGKPGAGKSTLMSFLLHHTKECVLAEASQEHVTVIDSFIHGRGADIQRSVVGVLRSLCHQLLGGLDLKQLHGTTHYVHLREKYVSSDPKTVMLWQTEELGRLLVELIYSVASSTRVLVFVDALDELGDEQAQDLSNYFSELNERISADRLPVKVCITCRHYPVVFNADELSLCVEEHNKGDISSYVADKFNRLASLASEYTKIEEFVVSNSAGIFQWADLVMQLATRMIKDGKSEAAVLRNLRSIPAELEDIYMHILTHVINPEDRQQSFFFLSSLCFAYEPLSLDTMRQLFRASYYSLGDSPEEQYIIESNEQMKRLGNSLSGGLAEVVRSYGDITYDDGSDSPITSYEEVFQFIHQSVQDFFVSRGLDILRGQTTRCGLSQKISAVVHANLFESCVKRFLILKLPHPCPDGYYIPGDIEGFESYAARYFLRHAQDSESLYLPFVMENLTWLVKLRLFADYQIWYGYNICISTMTIAASNFGLQDMVYLLLKNGADTNDEDDEGNTALVVAASSGHLEIVEMLLDAGAYVDGREDKEFPEKPTALNYASANNHIEVIATLIKSGANLNRKNDSGSTLLHNAKSIDVLRLLLSAGVDIDGGNGTEAGTALCEAVKDNNIERAEFLLSQGANVDAIDSINHTPLFLATTHWNNPDMFRLLLLAGASVNMRNFRAETVLVHAVTMGRVEAISLLLQHGADANLGNYNGSAPLYLAVKFTSNPEILRLLLLAGADVNAGAGIDTLALFEAIYRREEGHAKMLLQHGADSNIVGLTSSKSARSVVTTPLFIAIYQNNADMVRLLIEHGADVHRPLKALFPHDTPYDNALHYAIVNGSEAIITLLIDVGADVNASAGPDCTAVELATLMRRKGVRELLVSKGAVPS